MKESREVTIKENLLFVFQSTNNWPSTNRLVAAGTTVWVEKSWKSGAVKLRVKGTLLTRQLSPAEASRWI